MSESVTGDSKNEHPSGKTSADARQPADITLVGFRNDKSITAMPSNLTGASAQDTAADFPADVNITFPNQVGHFQINDEIARGGMGAIHRARDLDIGRDVALKLINIEYHEDSEAVHRFLKEARISGQLQHPGVVPVYELGFLPSRGPFFAMKLVQGKTLARLLKDRTSPEEELSKFLAIFEYVCQTIAYAHSRRIIHRDLKPQNIMVGEFGEVQVMDWGLAKSLDSEDHDPTWIRTTTNANSIPSANASLAIQQAATGMSLPGSVQGTPSYMAPEQARGQRNALDERCDVFGLGAILCEILTGKPPYRSGGGSQVLMDAQQGNLDETFERLKSSGADQGLIDLAVKCLASDAADRLSSAIEVAERMREYLASVQQRLHSAELARAAAQVKAKEERKARRLTLALAISISIAAIGSVLIGWRLADNKRARRESAERTINDAIHSAHVLREDAIATPGQNEKWAQAMAQVLQAEELLSVSDLTPAFRARVAPILKEFNQRERDRTILSRFEHIRLEASEVKDGAFNMRGIAPAYAEAFREYGIDVELLLEKAAPLLMAREIHNQLAAAIEDWGAVVANFGNDQGKAKRLFALADLIDPDEWRGKLRQAHLSNDKKAFIELGKSANPKVQPVTALHMLSGALMQHGEYNLAADLLIRTRRQYPGDFWTTHQLANCLENTNPPRHLESLGYYNAAATLRPNSPGVHLNLGVAYHNLGQENAYEEATREAIRLKPDYAEAYLNLGSASLAKGRYDDALLHYRKALQCKPNFVLAYRQLGFVHEALGEIVEAIENFRNAWKLTKSERTAAFSVAMLGFQSNLSTTEPLTIFTELTKLRPDDPDYWYQLAQCNMWLGNYDEALAAFKKCESLAQPNSNGKMSAASWIQRCEKLIELRPEIDEILHDQLKPESFKDYLNFALLCASRKRYANAAKFVEGGLSLIEGTPQTYVDLRFEGARYASLVSSEHAADAKSLTAEEKRKWRKQSVKWLSDIMDLNAQQYEASFSAAGEESVKQQIKAGKNARQLRNDRARFLTVLVRRLSIWQVQTDFKWIRDPNILATYSVQEREELSKFWQRVSTQRKKVIASLRDQEIP